MTYIFPTSTGSFQHEDFKGNKGTIGPGDLQWMTAGRGIVHSEMPVDLGPDKFAHGLQLWLNLRASEKMCEPRYQELPAAKVPKVKKDGIEAHVIAGTALGTTSPVYTLTKCHYIHFHMDAQTTLHQPITPGWNSFLYSIAGRISVGTPNEKKLVDAHNTITLTNQPGQTGITVTTFDEPANFVFLAGEVIGEPIVQHGPFVLTSREEVMKTFRDFQEGRNGFENSDWRSEIGRPITDHM